MFKKILYPTAFEEFSRDVLRCVANFKNLGTEEIVLLHVIYASQLPQVHEGYVLRPADALRHSVNAKMDEAAGIVEAAGIRAKKRIELAKTADISLIGMGSHGKGRAEGILWGSVSRNVAEYSDRPILVIKD